MLPQLRLLTLLQVPREPPEALCMADLTLTAIPDMIGKTAVVTGASAGRALFCR
jgi:hypothetical protein